MGTLHEASIKVIKLRRHESHDDYAAKLLKGVKPGITLPIELYGKIVGSVGINITGDSEIILKFGLLVKKQTEILLREEVFIRSSLLRERALQNLIQEISVFDPAHSDELVLLTRGQELGYNLKPPHIAIVIDLFRFNDFTKEIKQQALKSGSTELRIQSIKLNVLLIWICSA